MGKRNPNSEKQSYGKKRYIERSQKTEDIRKIIIIQVEGKTEKQYFEDGLKNKLQKQEKKLIDIKVRNGNGTNPVNLLNDLKDYLIEEYNDTKEDMLTSWLVFDTEGKEKDDKSFEDVLKWVGKNRKLAISNPFFEYWLLLHFEKGDKIKNKKSVETRLKKNEGFSEYNHVLNESKLKKLMQNIDTAVSNAKNRDNPKCIKFPSKLGSTTVYRLIEQIQKDIGIPKKT